MKSFRVKNIKSIKDSGEVEFGKITVFIGANNSGKSAFLRTLLLLKQTLRHTDSKTPLILKGDYDDFGSFKDIIHKHDINKSIGISFCLKTKLTDSTLDFTTSYDETEHELNIKSYSAFSPSGNGMRYDEITNEMTIYEDKDLELTLSGTDILPTSQNFILLSRTLLSDYNKYIDISNALSHLPVYISNIKYIGTLRVPPKRFYQDTGRQPDEIGINGENTEIFIYKAITGSNGESQLKPNIEKWLDKFNITKNLIVREIDDFNYQILIRDPKTGVPVNIKDTGSGLSQVLPILVQSFTSADSLLIFEEPEIHLHPNAQSELADLFVDITKEDKQVVIETHSDHLVSRLQRLIAEGKIDKDDVCLYGVEKKKDGSHFNRIEIDEYGQIED